MPLMFSAWFKRKAERREREIDAELRFHLREEIETQIARGLSPEAAERQALLAFGGSEQVKEECRDVHRIASWESTRSNLKSGVRFIRKWPGFSLTVMATLALGIGANSAVFSAVNAVVLHALPYPASDCLIVFHQYKAKGKRLETNVSTQRLEDWNRLSSAFRGITGYYKQDLSETSGPLPEKLTEALVAPRFLQVLGISPLLGRDFTAEEERFGGPQAALISFHLWRRRFHGNSRIFGQSLRFGHYHYRIIGVLPASFAIPDRETDLWSVSSPDAPFAQDRASTWFSVIGRLRPRVTLTQAQGNLTAVQAQLAHQFPKTDRDIQIGLEPLKDSILGSSGTSLWLLFAAVSLLLLLACLNIAALLLARTAERAREIAIRYSLGATRGSIVVQLLTESLLLSLAGSLFGLALAGAGSTIFRSLAKSLPRVNEIHLDWRIASYTIACAVLCTLLFGLLPALEATRRSAASTLANSSRTQIRGSGTLQWLLVGAQVALAVTLLSGAALLLRSFQALGQVAPGFDPSHVLTLRVSGSWGETADYKALTQRVDRELTTLRNVPGVIAAASSATLPGSASEYPREFTLIEGHALTDRILSDQKAVSAGYFSTLRIPVLSGTGCQVNTAWSTSVVNRSFVRAFLGAQPAVGRHMQAVRDAFLAEPSEIVGVVADAHENGLRSPAQPIVYACFSAPDPSPYLLVRTHGAAAAIVPSLRRKLQQLEPARSVFDIVPLAHLLSDSNAETRLRTLLLSLFAFTAIALAALGLYGSLTYSVNGRRREVGLRMALGAVPAQILRRFLLQGLAVAAAGCLTGLALAAAFSKLLSGMLYGITRADAASYGSAAAVALLVAAFAAALPAFRAARLDPMRTLREQ